MDLYERIPTVHAVRSGAGARRTQQLCCQCVPDCMCRRVKVRMHAGVDFCVRNWAMEDLVGNGSRLIRRGNLDELTREQKKQRSTGA